MCTWLENTYNMAGNNQSTLIEAICFSHKFYIYFSCPFYCLINSSADAEIGRDIIALPGSSSADAKIGRNIGYWLPNNPRIRTSGGGSPWRISASATANSEVCRTSICHHRCINLAILLPNYLCSK